MAAPAVAQQSNWDKLPRMQLERQFAGPLQDTIIQRWRDPADGAVCYIYLPITAAHTAPTASGFVQYGANTIGSLSCFPGPTQVAAPGQIAAPAQPAQLAPPPPMTTPTPAPAPATPPRNARPPAPGPANKRPPAPASIAPAPSAPAEQ
jgi:hypothetical protein